MVAMPDDTAIATPPVAPSTPNTSLTAAPSDTPTGAAPVSTTPAAVPAPEVTYSLTLPAESPLDPAAIERTVAIARAQGLSTEAAQAMLDYAHTEATSVQTAFLTSYQPGGAEWQKQADAWKAQAQADPSLGATPDARQQAIQQGAGVVRAFAKANPAGGQKLVEFLDASGLGNHPAVVGLFKWLGESNGEAGFHAMGGAPAPKEKPLTEIFYGPPSA